MHATYHGEHAVETKQSSTQHLVLPELHIAAVPLANLLRNSEGPESDAQNASVDFSEAPAGLAQGACSKLHYGRVTFESVTEGLFGPGPATNEFREIRK